MIERVALIKLEPEHTGAEARAGIVRRAQAELAPLPGVVSLTTGVPADAASEASWDVMIRVRCRTEADLEAYRGHPVHRRFVEEAIAPVSAVRKAWSFVVE